MEQSAETTLRRCAALLSGIEEASLSRRAISMPVSAPTGRKTGGKNATGYSAVGYGAPQELRVTVRTKGRRVTRRMPERNRRERIRRKAAVKQSLSQMLCAH